MDGCARQLFARTREQCEREPWSRDASACACYGLGDDRLLGTVLDAHMGEAEDRTAPFGKRRVVRTAEPPI